MRFQREEVRRRTLPCSRAEGRSSGRQRTSRRMPVSAWPAGRILPLKEFSLPTRSTSRARVSTSLDSTKDLRIESAPSTVLIGCAKNRRKTRGAWASADGSHCSASDDPERTTPSVLGSCSSYCKPSFQPLSKLR